MLDRLAVMFDKQNEMDLRVGSDHTHEAKSEELLSSRLQGLIRACRHELVELESSTPWKWWRPKEAQPFDTQNVKVEIIDLHHFIMSMALALEMTPRDAANNLYDAKTEYDDGLGFFFIEARNALTMFDVPMPLDEDMQVKILQYCVSSMHMLLAELQGAMNWEWPDTPAVNRPDARVYVAELLATNILMSIVLGLDEESFFAAYEAKLAVNHQRQDSGYVTKDESDCRHI